MTSYEVYTIKNGVKCLFVSRKDLPIFSAMLIFKTGSIDDPNGKSGIANLFSEVVFKRSSKSSKLLFEVEAEEKGIYFDTEVTKELTIFSVSSLLLNYEEAINLFLEMIEKSFISERDFLIERDRAIAEIKKINDDPQLLAMTKFRKLMYYKSGFERLTIGKIKDLVNLTLEDLKNFRKTLKTKELLFVVCADFNNKVEKKIKNLFVQFSKNQKPQNFQKEFNFQLPEKLLIKHEKKDLNQSIIISGSFAPSLQSKDFFKFKLASLILGSGWGSRLVSNVREKEHLAYYAYSFFEPNGFSRGIAGGICGVNNEKIKFSLELLDKIFYDLLTKNVSKKELERAKGYYKGILSTTLESSIELAKFYSNYLLFKGKVFELEELFKIIDSINQSDIKYVFNHYFDKRFTFTLVPEI